MTYREIAILVFCASFFLFFVVLAIQQQKKQKKRADVYKLVNGQMMLDAENSSSIDSGIEATGWYQKRVQTIQSQLNQLYDDEQTPESIIKLQLHILVYGLALTVLVHLVLQVFIITIICLFLTLYCFILPDLQLKSQIKKKYADFDAILPQYESNLLLGLEAGASLHKAMEMAVRTLPPGLVQIEFRQLLLENSMYADNVALPYMRLSQRIPTKDCERFCNIVISGLKNGNSMSDILKQEGEYMSAQQLNRIKEQGEKNTVKSTAIVSGMVFMPLIIIFIAPLMANSM